MKDVRGVFELVSKTRTGGHKVTVKEWMHPKYSWQKFLWMGRAWYCTRNRLRKNTRQEKAGREQNGSALGKQCCSLWIKLSGVMAGPVPQRSAVESSNNQAPKQDLGPERYLHTLGRRQMLLSPAAGLVQRTGELVGEVREEMGSLHRKFSAGFYFSPALLQLFLEVSLL